MRGWLGVLAMCALGCGTSSGNPIDGDDSDKPMDERTVTGNEGNAWDEPYGCERKPSEIQGDTSTVTPLGFSADDVLAFAAGTHESTIRWQPSEMVTYGPESGEHAFTLTVRYAGGALRHIAYTEKSASADEAVSNVGIDRASACDQLGALELDVEVEVATDGGALAERMQGTLYASNRNWAQLVLPLEESMLGGDFAVTDTRPAGGKLVQLNLSIGLSPLGLRGTLDGIVEYRMGDVVGAAAGRGPLAEIGDAATCEQGGLQVDVDRSIDGLSAQAGLDAVAAVRSARGTWLDGTMTEVTLQLTHDGAAVCAVLGSNGMPAPINAASFRLGGRLAATSADGRLDADWPVTIEVLSDRSGALSEVNVQLDHAGLGTIAGSQLAQVYGVPDLQLSGFDGYQIAMELRVRIGGGAQPPSFRLSIAGWTEPECESAPPPPDSGESGGASSPGCRGRDATELESLTF